ncbi:MAG TPA: hypothetical protein ENF27_00090 [Chloroflexi bacterium]|nr:MAG: hypothetical protein DRI65_11130 [Chloroflexota bacterium]HDN04321.1 hypothetical protein [Chloroflexota bacterium]
MSNSVIVHIRNAEPMLAEIDEMPQLTDVLIKLSNPRQKDGKDLIYLERNVVTVYWPWSEISFLEILPGDTAAEVVSFIRE